MFASWLLVFQVSAPVFCREAKIPDFDYILLSLWADIVAIMDDEESWLYGDPSEMEDQSKSAANEDVEQNDQPDLDVMFFSLSIIDH